MSQRIGETEKEQAELERPEKELLEAKKVGSFVRFVVNLLISIAFLGSFVTGSIIVFGRSGVSAVSLSESPELFTLFFILYGVVFTLVVGSLWRRYVSA
jgi:hypothetical protein